MLEKFKIKGDTNRNKVLKYISQMQLDLNKFKIKEFNDYPGGISLVDNKKRRIIIYNDYIMNKIRVIYEGLKQSEEDAKYFIKNVLWEDYEIHSEEIGEVARLERDGKGNIRFYRYRFTDKNTTENVHTSRMFDEKNELYDIYFYFEEQINLMIKKRKENKEELVFI